MGSKLNKVAFNAFSPQFYELSFLAKPPRGYFTESLQDQLIAADSISHAFQLLIDMFAIKCSLIF